jgi:hypothetical protein
MKGRGVSDAPSVWPAGPANSNTSSKIPQHGPAPIDARIADRCKCTSCRAIFGRRLHLDGLEGSCRVINTVRAGNDKPLQWNAGHHYQFKPGVINDYAGRRCNGYGVTKGLELLTESGTEQLAGGRRTDLRTRLAAGFKTPFLNTLSIMYYKRGEP